MTSKKISNTLGSMQTSFESAWNRIFMGVRTKRMPKTIKRVKQTLNMGSTIPGTSGTVYYGEEGMLANTVFYTQYMGSTLLEDINNEQAGANYHNTGLSSKALDRIVRMSRNRNLVDVRLKVSGSGLQVVRIPEGTALLDIPIDRLVFCANDTKYSKVTAFAARNSVNETLECHAFLFHRQKLAKSMADTLSRAFQQHKDQMLCESSDRLSASRATGKVDTLNAVAFEKREETTPKSTCRTTHSVGDREMSSHKGAISSKLNYEENPKLVLAHSLAEEGLDTGALADTWAPVSRARADSDSWAVMAAGPTESNSDVELEFSSFARSRSTTNLADLHTSMHSEWDI